MTRMTGPDCVVMCNLINTYIHTYIHTYIRYITVYYYKDALQQTGYESIETTVCTRRFCGRGHCSAWMGGHRLTKRVMSGELENARGNVGRGGGDNGWTAWQSIVGYLASRGAGAPPPHLILGFDTTAAQYAEGAVGLWPRR